MLSCVALLALTNDMYAILFRTYDLWECSVLKSFSFCGIRIAFLPSILSRKSSKFFRFINEMVPQIYIVDWDEPVI